MKLIPAPGGWKLEIRPGEPNELIAWWMHTAMEDLQSALPKIEEYGGGESGGSSDLRLIGANIAELLGWRDVPDAVKQEVGCWFYLQGKVARLVSDYKQRRAGKDDTWHDATVYSMMARRLQETGNWP